MNCVKKVTKTELLSVVTTIALQIGLVILLLHKAPVACAQATTASLSGVVFDEAGAGGAGVNITLINTGTGSQGLASTTDEGYFIIPMLAAGSYALTAEMPNFASVTINDIVLETSTNSLIQ